MILVCAHAGLKTGEDGPTHADPQALQLLQEDFPRGTAISLTPWEPQEIWTLVAAALAKRPALISAFVTRPNEPVLDREALGLAPPEAAAESPLPPRTDAPVERAVGETGPPPGRLPASRTGNRPLARPRYYFALGEGLDFSRQRRPPGNFQRPG
jgi:hypothetical protein